MVRTAICAFTVQHIEESVHDILGRVADAGYDGFQFSKRRLWGDATPGEIRATLEETGLEATPAHFRYEELTDDAVLDAHETLGIDAGVLASLPAERFATAEAVDGTAADVEGIADDLGDRGWELHYHNHDREFTDLGTEAGFERFVDATDIGIELDLGWALAGGADPVALIERIDDRLDLVHVRDVAVGDGQPRSAELGEGDVDLEACAAAARAADAEWFVYEHDPEDPVASIDHGISVLETL